MKVMFIETPYVFFPRLINVYTPNPGPLAVAAYLEREGHDVSIVDTIALDLSWRDIKSILRREEPEVIGISCVTKNAYLGMALAALCKEVLPDVVILAGGPHFSLCPELSLQICPEIDFAVVGEGEVTAAELLRALEERDDDEQLRQIPGLAFLRGGEVICTPTRQLVEDLDELPMPAYHMVPMDRYSLPFFGPGGMGAGFSRGCTHSCTFCSENIQWQQTWRGRSPEWMVEELDLLVNRYGRLGYWMNDPSFLHNPERIEGFIAKMQGKRLPIRFHMQVRADHVIRDRALLPGLVDIGCKMAMVGVESHRQSTLDEWRKDETLSQIAEAAGHLHASGIPILMTCLMWGTYEDDRQSVRDLVKWAYEIGGFFLAHDLIVPWPGSPYYDEMVRLGRVETWDWRKYDFDHAIMPTRHLDRRELELANLHPFFSWWFNARRVKRGFTQEDRRRMITWQLQIPGLVASFLARKRLLNAIDADPIEAGGERYHQRHLEVLGVQEGSPTPGMWRAVD